MQQFNDKLCRKNNDNMLLNTDKTIENVVRCGYDFMQKIL